MNPERDPAVPSSAFEPVPAIRDGRDPTPPGASEDADPGTIETAVVEEDDWDPGEIETEEVDEE